MDTFVFMKRIKIRVVVLLIMILRVAFSYSQVDYSEKWEDYYSYNNVKSFVRENDKIHAIVDNAVFTYDINSAETFKVSSVNGLLGESTSAIAYSSSEGYLAIGYENGVLDLIQSNGKITRVVDILLSDVSTNKKVNKIFERNGLLYLSMEFGIVVYSLSNLEFVDTYFIGDNSSPVVVNSILLNAGYIYAASENGVYVADLSSNLADSSNWRLYSSGSYSNLMLFGNKVLVSKGKSIFEIENQSNINELILLNNTVVDVNVYEGGFICGTSKQAFIYDENYSLIKSTSSSSSNITTVYSDGNNIILGTDSQGLNISNFSSPNTYSKIYPDGPVSNEVFSITVKNNDLWVVYGAYDHNYTPVSTKQEVTHFDGGLWYHIDYSTFNAPGLVHVTVDPANTEKVYISSWAQGSGSVDAPDKGGMLVVEDNQFSDFWNRFNSGIRPWPQDGRTSGFATTRIDGSVFDSQGNLWVTNSIVDEGLKKYSPSEGTWAAYKLSKEIIYLNQVIVDNQGNKWIGSRRDGLFAFNENGLKNVNMDSENSGLTHNNVRTVASDKNNNIWIGTPTGLFRFTDVTNVFSGDFEDPAPVIIVDEGQNQKLLGDSSVNTILVDGADNKWFGTSTGGVIHTNSTGQKTLAKFNKDNSPLPSNFIKKIQIDETTGKVYFLTEKGIVSYKSDIAPYGEELTEVYGYPNPAYKHHHEISITGKDGANLPYGTNVKILDVAGNLVFESNTIESQSGFGGKIVWNKKNLSGVQVASGVYVVLLYNESGTQTSSTKIAVIN